MSLRVAVLGCGPAGLMAVHAAAIRGCDVLVLSKPRKSRLYGAQYLHAPIEDMTPPQDFVEVNYVLEGSVEGYRAKVYGTDSRVEVSPESLGTQHLAWDIRSTYDGLWEMYGDYVMEIEAHDITSEWLGNLGADVIVSTLPAPVLCRSEAHTFATQDVWAMGDAPELGQRVPIPCDENTVVCNGDRNISWYRVSNIFGHKTVEWSLEAKPPLEGVARVSKPLHTTCDCFPDVARMGRYGKWTKGVLSHSAYEETKALIGAGIQGTMW